MKNLGCKSLDWKGGGTGVDGGSANNKDIERSK